MTPLSTRHLAVLARSLAARLPRAEALATLLDAIAACHPELARSAVFLSETGRLIAASGEFDRSLLPERLLAWGDEEFAADSEDRLWLHALGGTEAPGYWAIEVRGIMPSEETVEALHELVATVFATPGQNVAGDERDQLVRIERLERDQALMQSLLAQIDTLILAEDEQHMLDVVCTQLVETGLFLSAWVVPAEHGTTPIATGGDSAPIEQPDKAVRAILVAAIRRAHALADAGQRIVLDERIAEPFARLSWFDMPPIGALVPLFRDEHLWAFLVVVAASESDLDSQVTEVLTHLGQLVNRSLAQLDLRARLAEEQRRNTYLAYHDPLTNLANRRAVEAELPKAVGRAERHQQMLAVALLDLDDFKPINDRFGHAAGDHLLMTIAARLKAAIRETDLAARLGGDEFLLILEDIEDDTGLAQVLDRVATTIRQPIHLDGGVEVHANGSIGVTRYPIDDSAPEQLIRNADAALYAAKNSKRLREHDWIIWEKEPGADDEGTLEYSHSVAPYGKQAERLLQRIQPELDDLTGDFIDRFYRELAKESSIKRIIDRLSPEQFDSLKTVQADHLGFLLDPTLTEAAHAARARQIGHIHALSGVSASDLVRAITVYMHEFNETFARVHLNQRHQNQLERVFTERLSRELSYELDAAQAVEDEFQGVLTELDRSRRRERNWPAFNEHLIDTLAALPGILGVSILSPDGDGHFVANYAEGADVFAATSTRGERRATLDLKRRESGHPVSRAYREARIAWIDNYREDPDARPWRTRAHAREIASSAAVPILDDREQPMAVICLHSWVTGMFATGLAQGFSQRLMALVSQTWRQIRNPATLLYAKGDYDRWRQAFYEDGLEMVFQPVIDVRTGQTTHLEALARLYLASGEEILPNMFIPWLNEGQVMRLFEQGLDQSLACLRALEHRRGTRLSVAVNLPVSVLVNPVTPGHIRSALDRHGIDAARVTLELLEHGDSGVAHGDLAQAMHAIGALGVGLAMDDLGSGYNNLLRLRGLPFNTVKIDQGMVRAAQHEPARVLTFIASMIQMAHALELRTVVEGLESWDLVEATALLGGQLGQGFAIARPMRQGALTDWLDQFAFRIDPARPSTPLGAMAALWGLRTLGRAHLEQSARHQELRAAAAWWATENLDRHRVLATDILGLLQGFHDGQVDGDGFGARLQHFIDSLDRLIRESAA